jgi:hypothetical protein
MGRSEVINAYILPRRRCYFLLPNYFGKPAILIGSELEKMPKNFFCMFEDVEKKVVILNKTNHP